MSRHAAPIELHPRQRGILEQLARTRTIERRLAERVHIVLGAAAGKTNIVIAAEIGADAQRVTRWRKRFAAAHDKLAVACAQDVSDGELQSVIVEALTDDERCGCPGKFTAEQLADIIALACRKPEDLGVPVTHWTPRELALWAQAQGIVESISPRHIARFFGAGRAASASLEVLA